MCTVTYLPHRENGYFLTSNRDEAPHRAASGLEEVVLDKTRVLLPRDKEAGGTWIGVNEWGITLCLLNGAFEVHERQLPYRISRGLLMLDLLQHLRPLDVFLSFNLDNIEPFTLVAASPDALWELRWNGHSRFARSLDRHTAHIWSSSTLYHAAIRQRRAAWFYASTAALMPAEANRIMAFHKEGGEGNPHHDIVMNRNDLVRTVSITQVCREPGTSAVLFHDILTGREEKKALYDQ